MVLSGSDGSILGFFNWIKDPENQKKYNEFIDFFVTKFHSSSLVSQAFLGLKVGSVIIGVLSTLTGVVTGLDY